MSPEFIIVRRSLESQVRELPPLSTAVVRVLEAAQDPLVSLEEIGGIVASDPALAAKVLRTVNSSYYGLSRQVASISQAVVILGTQQVRNVTLAAAAAGAVASNAKASEAILREFWAHAFATAETAGGIVQARGEGIKRVGELQTAGLLADIGRLFIYSNHPEAFMRLVELAAASGRSLDLAEAEEMRLPHAAVGAEIAERWGLPSATVAAIAGHEGSFGADATGDDAIVGLADWAHKTRYEFAAALAPPTEPIHRCGLSAGEWDEIVASSVAGLAATDREMAEAV